MSGHPGADRVQVPINLRVVGGFVAAQVAPQKEAGHQQHNSAHDQGQAKAGIAGGLLPAQVPVRSRQGRMFAGFNCRRVVHGRRGCRFHITCPSNIAVRPVRRIPWRGPVRAWRGCERTGWKYSFHGPPPPSPAPATTSRLSVTPAANRSRAWVRVCSARSTELRATCTCWFGRLDIQQRGADLVFNLAAQIIQLGAGLAQRGLGLQHVGVNFAALKDRNVQPAGHRESAVRIPEIDPQIAVIGGHIEGGKVFRGRAFAIVLGGPDLLRGRQVIGAGRIRPLQALLRFQPWPGHHTALWKSARSPGLPAVRWRAPAPASAWQSRCARRSTAAAGSAIPPGREACRWPG